MAEKIREIKKDEMRRLEELKKLVLAKAATLRKVGELQAEVAEFDLKIAHQGFNLAP